MKKEGQEKIPQTKIKKEKLEMDTKFLFMLEESIPVEGNARKRYVADIALFYHSVFKNKLQHFIGEQMVELSKIGQSELMTNIIRSNINAFHLIDTWMLQRQNEHLGNLEQMRQAFGTEDQFTEEFKKTYL